MVNKLKKIMVRLTDQQIDTLEHLLIFADQVGDIKYEVEPSKVDKINHLFALVEPKLNNININDYKDKNIIRFNEKTAPLYKKFKEYADKNNITFQRLVNICLTILDE